MSLPVDPPTIDIDHEDEPLGDYYLEVNEDGIEYPVRVGFPALCVQCEAPCPCGGEE